MDQSLSISAEQRLCNRLGGWLGANLLCWFCYDTMNEKLPLVEFDSPVCSVMRRRYTGIQMRRSAALSPMADQRILSFAG